MRTIIFSGRVYPTTTGISISPLPVIQTALADLGVTYLRLSGSIKDNNVIVKCECNKCDERDFAPILIRAIDWAKAPIDLLSFQKGIGLHLVLESYSVDSGTYPLHPEGPGLTQLVTAVDPQKKEQLLNLIKLVSTNKTFFLALRDLTETLTVTHVSPRNTYRAIEGIRHLISPNEKNTRASWEALRITLRVDRSYLKSLETTSTGARHGSGEHVPGSIQRPNVHKAWTLMNRYMEFALRGGVEPLPIEDFPVLT